MNTTGTIASMKRISSQLTLDTPRSKLVSIRLRLATWSASWPK